MLKYQCHSENKAGPRGRSIEWMFQDGWRYYTKGAEIVREAVMKKGVTHWKPIACGKLPDTSVPNDIHCIGCDNNGAQ